MRAGIRAFLLSSEISIYPYKLIPIRCQKIKAAFRISERQPQTLMGFFLDFKMMAEYTAKSLTDKLLSEKVPPAGICRAVGLSQRRLQSYVGEKYKHIEKKTEPLPKEKNPSDSRIR